MQRSRCRAMVGKSGDHRLQSLREAPPWTGCCIAESRVPLTCSDVLVQSTGPGKLQDDKGDEAGHVTSPASDFVLRL